MIWCRGSTARCRASKAPLKFARRGRVRVWCCTSLRPPDGSTPADAQSGRIYAKQSPVLPRHSPQSQTQGCPVQNRFLIARTRLCRLRRRRPLPSSCFLLTSVWASREIMQVRRVYGEGTWPFNGASSALCFDWSLPGAFPSLSKTGTSTRNFVGIAHLEREHAAFLGFSAIKLDGQYYIGTHLLGRSHQ